MTLLDKFRLKVKDLVRNDDGVHEEGKNETMKADASYLSG